MEMRIAGWKTANQTGGCGVYTHREWDMERLEKFPEIGKYPRAETETPVSIPRGGTR